MVPRDISPRLFIGSPRAVIWQRPPWPFVSLQSERRAPFEELPQGRGMLLSTTGVLEEALTDIVLQLTGKPVRQRGSLFERHDCLPESLLLRRIVLDQHPSA